MKIFYLVPALIFLIASGISAQEPYFPPISGDNWDTISPNELAWNTNNIEPLYNFLEEKNSKAFILLKDGKIVLEKYFGSFNKDSLWYWASAGKSLTAALVGIAQDEGFLNINDPTSRYLGTGWTSVGDEKEDNITIFHQLTMTTGLDHNTENSDCTDPECLEYLAEPGSKWYYHNAPYTLLEEVVAKATGTNYNVYSAQKIKNKIGMNGAWVKIGFNNIYLSNARSFARYGLMILNDGKWQNQTILSRNYLDEMTNKSQELNKSYGYLWWLNGYSSFMLPGTENTFDGPLYPDAPADVITAMGKNGQILNIAPADKLVFIRMGNAPDDDFFISTLFNNEIWKHLNNIMDDVSSIKADESRNAAIYPNPANNVLNIKSDAYKEKLELFNSLGVKIMERTIETDNTFIELNNLSDGIYFIKIKNDYHKVCIIK